MLIENSVKRQGEIVQVGIDESMVKVRYTDGSESWEDINNLALAGGVTAGK